MEGTISAKITLNLSCEAINFFCTAANCYLLMFICIYLWIVRSPSVAFYSPTPSCLTANAGGACLASPPQSVLLFSILSLDTTVKTSLLPQKPDFSHAHLQLYNHLTVPLKVILAVLSAVDDPLPYQIETKNKQSAWYTHNQTQNTCHSSSCSSIPYSMQNPLISGQAWTVSSSVVRPCFVKCYGTV